MHVASSSGLNLSLFQTYGTLTHRCVKRAASARFLVVRDTEWISRTTPSMIDVNVWNKSWLRKIPCGTKAC